MPSTSISATDPHTGETNARRVVSLFLNTSVPQRDSGKSKPLIRRNEPPSAVTIAENQLRFAALAARFRRKTAARL